MIAANALRIVKTLPTPEQAPAGASLNRPFGVCDPEVTFSSGPAPSRGYSPAPGPSTTAFTVPVNSNPSLPAPIAARHFSSRIAFGRMR